MDYSDPIWMFYAQYYIPPKYINKYYVNIIEYYYPIDYWIMLPKYYWIILTKYYSIIFLKYYCILHKYYSVILQNIIE